MSTNGYSFVGASPHRLLGGYQWAISEPTHVWQSEWQQLAARGQQLWQNDPFAQAMVRAKIFGTHGAAGLQFRSLYQADDVEATSDTERTTRRTIESQIGLASKGYALDSGGLLTRKQIEEAIDVVATVKGDCFAVRRLISGYPTATRWRVIQPERVCNPPGKMNSDILSDGIAKSADGVATGIWIDSSSPDAVGPSRAEDFQFIPWYAPDGTPNVVHKVGLRIPGMDRGVSMFAPLIMLMKQMGGVLDAHVAGKRAQACNPIIVKTQDKELYADADANNATLGPYTSFAPLQVLFAHEEDEVLFQDPKFNGSDFEAFARTNWRLATASWGFPVEVVLAQMGEASLASARAGLDHFNRRCHELQNEHISCVTSVIDESIVREAVAVGSVSVNTTDWRRIMAGKYLRPAKFVTDSQKEATAVLSEIEAGRSRRNAFADRGWDWEAEQEERRQEDGIAADLGQEGSEDA